MPELPSGTVTLLFTDMEGSTRLLQELGRERYVEALNAHRQLLRSKFAAAGGHEVEMQGDSFHYAFRSARDAVCGAAEAQRSLESHPVRVRIGIHTGEPVQSEGLYTGLDVHRAARVMSAAHGAQILLSARTAEFIADELPDDFELLDLGAHRLKDLDQEERLFQLVVPGLRATFPPPKTLDGRTVPLPTPPTPLVGRVEEVEALRRLVAREGARLVTLTGPGGTGKTRLALAAAERLAPRFADGARFVQLAALADATLVRPAIAAALDLEPDAELEQELAGRELLLVLDNFEQLLDGAHQLTELLEAVPRVTLIVTSRSPLRLALEREFAVPPLSETESVALLRERIGGQAADVTALVDVARRLEGLPLALELAAARVRILGVEGLRDRLEHTLPLLTRGARDAPDRQRTLSKTIAWSEDLLGEEERRVFAALSVFAKAFTADDAEAVCDASLDALDSLVDHALLQSRDGRFQMLRVIREYARDRLDATGEGEAVRQRHADWCLALAVSADEGYRGEDSAAWLTRIEDRHDDLRAALAWARDTQRYELMLDLAVALSVFWQTHGHLREGLAWFEEVLARSAAVVDARRLAGAANEAGVMAYRTGDYDRAVAIIEQQLALCRELGHERGIALALTMLANVATDRGELDRARLLDQEALQTARAADDERAVLVALTTVGNRELVAGGYERAAETFEECVELARTAGRNDAIPTALFNVGLARVLSGNDAGAEEPLRESLRLSHERGDRELVAYALEALAAVALLRRETRAAGVLLGAAAALLEVSGALLESVERALHDRTEAKARATLGDAFDAAWAEGNELSIEQAVALGLASRSPHVPRSS